MHAPHSPVHVHHAYAGRQAGCGRQASRLLAVRICSTQELWFRLLLLLLLVLPLLLLHNAPRGGRNHLPLVVGCLSTAGQKFVCCLFACCLLLACLLAGLLAGLWFVCYLLACLLAGWSACINFKSYNLFLVLSKVPEGSVYSLIPVLSQ